VALLTAATAAGAAENSVHITANQIRRGLRQRLRIEPILGSKVLTFCVAQFSHTPQEGRIQMRDIWHLAQIADHRHRRLLRSGRERPCCCAGNR